MNDQFVVLNIHNLCSTSQNRDMVDFGSNDSTLPQQVTILISSPSQKIIFEPAEYFECG